MNTTSIRIEDGFNHLHNWQYLLELSVKRILAALEPKSSNAAAQHRGPPYQKKSTETFPTVSSIHGISYGENERDRLFYG
jgi:hypothetical protein